MGVVKIRRSALGQLIAAAYGALRFETSGIVAGEKYGINGESKYFVESAHPSQLAQRTVRGVNPNSAEDERISAILPSIGMFHSHLQTYTNNDEGKIYLAGKVWLGRLDFERLKKNIDGIEILVALNPAQRCSRVRIEPYLLHGCFEDKGKIYRVEIGAYYLDCQQRKRRAILDVRKKDAKSYFLS